MSTAAEAQPPTPGTSSLRAARTWGLAALAVVAGSAALLMVELSGAELALDGFGLASSLSWPYYAALSLLPFAAWIASRTGRPGWAWAGFAAVLVFVIAVWATPSVLEGTARFRTSYTSFGYVDPLLRGEGLLPDIFIYHNWPLFPIVFATLLKLTGISPEALLLHFPLVIFVLYLGPMGWLLARVEREGEPRDPAGGEGAASRLALPRGARWPLGLFVFAVFDWTGQDYFSPQALAFLVFLVWLCLLAEIAIKRDGVVSTRLFVVAILLFMVIVATHVLTALVGLFILTALILSRLVHRTPLLVASLLLFLAWQTYLAQDFFGLFGPRVVENVFSPIDFLQSNVGGRVSGSAEHADVSKLRIAVSGLAFLLGAAAAWRLQRAGRLKEPAARFAAAGVVGVIVAAPVSVYGGEMVIRALLFSLPFIAMLVVLAPRSRAFDAALVLVLAALAPLHVVTHYGNELYDYVSPDEQRGFEFVASLAPANLYGGYPGAAFIDSADLNWRNATVPTGPPPTLADYKRPQAHHWEDDFPIYVAVSRGDLAASTLFYDQPDLIPAVTRMLERNPRFVRVFSNDDYTVYRWLGPAPPPAGEAEP